LSAVWLDAILAYLHYTAIFLLFSFLVVETMMMRGALDATAVRLLGRVDIWFFGSAIAALATGLLRLVFGAKGPDFYLSSWPIYVKIALFVAVGVISVGPTLRFIRWRRMFDRDAAWRVPDAERRLVRRLIMIEVHLAAFIPLVAVIMSRGLGR
jgi:putative membrane protein